MNMEVSVLLPGFPLELGGTVKFRSRQVALTGGSDAEDQAAVARLAQLCEEELRGKLKHSQRSPEQLAQVIAEVATSPQLKPHLERIHAVRMVGNMLEVEFSAAGYPDRYASYVGLEGTGGRYRVRKLPSPVATLSSRCEWISSGRGTSCVAESLDEHGVVLARVTVGLATREGDKLVNYSGDGGVQPVEDGTMRMVRALPLMQVD